jgi:hypothetical protein
LHVVGLTREGEIALLRTVAGSEAIVLPGVTVDGAADGGDLLAVSRLLGTLGYDARELVTLSRYGIPDAQGSRGQSAILMAPLLSRRPAPRPSLSGLAVHEIPIAGAAGWLRERKTLVAHIDPKVWVGLLLAKRQFSSWARERLRASLVNLRGRRFSGTAVAPDSSRASVGVRGA